jgi:hypothetical protein
MPSLLIRSSMSGHPNRFRSVRDLGLVSPGCPAGSGAFQGCSSVWLPAARPAGIASGFKSICGSMPGPSATWIFSAFGLHVNQDHPVHIPRRHTSALQGMARVRSGQAPAWPLSSDRSVRRDSGVKRDFACTFAWHVSPVLVALRPQSRLRLEGRARTLSGPSPAQVSKNPVPPARYEDLLI